MRKKIIHLLSLLLCAAMVCGMLPNMTAFAAENILPADAEETIAYEGPQDPEEMKEESEKETTVETTEGLTEETTAELAEKPTEETTTELAEKPTEKTIKDPTAETISETAVTVVAEAEQLLTSDADDTEITQAEFETGLAEDGEYHLTKSLTLTSDLAVGTSYTNFLSIDQGGSITVPDGKVLTVIGGVLLDGGTITVESGGTLVLQNTGWLDVSIGSLIVENGAYFSAEAGTVYFDLNTGKISGVADSLLVAYIYVENFSELEAALQIEMKYYVLQIGLSSSVSLEKNITIPEGIFLYIINDSILTVPNQVTLTNKGVLSLAGGEFRIEEGGTLENYGTLYLNNGTFTLEGTLNEHSQASLEDGTFYTFAQLQEFVKAANDDPDSTISARYAGYTTLVIEEDLVIPENLSLYASSKSVTVPEGKSLTNKGYMTVGTLTVEGTMANQSLSVYKALTVTGILNNNGWISMNEGALLSGKENILCENAALNTISWNYQITDTATLKAAVAAANDSPDPDWVYQLTIYQNVTIDQSITIPENCDLIVNGTCTVSESCTLEVQCSTFIDGAMVVKGNLINQKTIMVQSGSYGATLTFADTGTYTGFGKIDIYGDNLESAILGLDLTNFQITEDDYSMWYHWQLTAKSVTFTTFAELKALDNQYYNATVTAWYEGTEPLVIEEDLTLPQNLQIYVWGRDGSSDSLVIPAGVTLCADGLISAYKMDIKGTLISKAVHIYETLIISGSLENNGRIEMVVANAQLTGAENILYGDQYCTVIWYLPVKDGSVQTLKERIAKANASEDTHWQYIINCQLTSLSINETLLVPGNCQLYFETDVTVEENCRLTLYGYTLVYAPLTIKGTLSNRYFVDIFYDNGGTMTITDGGTYTGSGSLCVNSEALTEPWAGVPGLDPDAFTATKGSEFFTGTYWALNYKQKIEPGDFDGDNKVTEKDAAALLWNTLYGSAWPIQSDGDVTGDGYVNEADVVYLLWHILFPDLFPLAE